MAKPGTIPIWNSGLANNVDPGGSKKALGWTNGEQPASSSFNWWMNLVYLWILWLNTEAFDDMSVNSLTVAGGASTPVGGAVCLSVGTQSHFGGGVFLDAGFVSGLTGTMNAPLVMNQPITLAFDAVRNVNGNNEISNRAVHKAHASIVLNNTSTPTLDANDSFNLAASTPVTCPGSNVLRVNFPSNFFGSSALPNVTVTLGDEKAGSPHLTAFIKARTRSSVDIVLRETTGTSDDPAGAGLNTLRVYVHAEGAQ